MLNSVPPGAINKKGQATTLIIQVSLEVLVADE